MEGEVLQAAPGDFCVHQDYSVPGLQAVMSLNPYILEVKVLLEAEGAVQKKMENLLDQVEVIIDQRQVPAVQLAGC